jgi:hypothetical protein
VVHLVFPFAVAFLVNRMFERPLQDILYRLIPEDISLAWARYLKFAIYVVGISSGVRIWEMEKYINPQYYGDGQQQIVALNADRWALEVYRTIIGTLSGAAWLLMVFFVVALIAYVIVRMVEARRRPPA